MQKSAFDVCLAKVASGDQSFLNKLGEYLAERLCYLPILQIFREDRTATVQAVVIEKDDRTLIPLFTNESRFKEWSRFTEHKGEVLSLLGGDVCAVVGSNGILIDPLTDYTVELTPEFVEAVGERLVISGNNEEDLTAEYSQIDQDIPLVAFSDPFSARPPGMSAQSKYEALGDDAPFPHEGTPESFNPDALDPVTATMVSNTQTFQSAVEGGETAEFEDVGERTETTALQEDPLIKRKSRTDARRTLDKEKRKRSFFSFFRSKE